MTQNITNVTVPTVTNVDRLVRDIGCAYECMSEAAECFNELYRLVGYRNRFGLVVSIDEVSSAWNILNTVWQAGFFIFVKSARYPASQPASQQSSQPVIEPGAKPSIASD